MSASEPPDVANTAACRRKQPPCLSRSITSSLESTAAVRLPQISLPHANIVISLMVQTFPGSTRKLGSSLAFFIPAAINGAITSATRELS